VQLNNQGQARDLWRTV